MLVSMRYLGLVAIAHSFSWFLGLSQGSRISFHHFYQFRVMCSVLQCVFHVFLAQMIRVWCTWCARWCMGDACDAISISVQKALFYLAWLSFIQQKVWFCLWYDFKDVKTFVTLFVGFYKGCSFGYKLKVISLLRSRGDQIGNPVPRAARGHQD